MAHLQQNIYSSVPRHEYLGLLDNPAGVAKFLDLDKEDVSKAANIAKASVRYDLRIPLDLKDFFIEIAFVCELVAENFDGDPKITALWFKVSNPMLGNISPRDMIRYGRFKKLKKIIYDQKEGNIP
jgi:hypothetical protein